MQEVLTFVAYLVAWLVCEWVIGIESGLTKLLLSLGFAVAVYLLLALRGRSGRSREKGR